MTTKSLIKQNTFLEHIM